MLSSVPATIRQQVAAALNTELKDFSFCAGGCINQAGKLVTAQGNYFLKWNDANTFRHMFAAEAKGLALLKKSSALRIPEVITPGDIENWQFLLLEFIEEAPKSGTYWADLGYQLAALHRQTAPTFGLAHNNYIGALPQVNTPGKQWTTFFIEHRLQPQLELAADHKRINKEVVRQFDSLFNRLPGIFPEEKPSLLHGDLWSGNVITGEAGQPCLIDPAVYYGHREAEIAFTTLFGGFSPGFYHAYQEAFPMQEDYENRFIIYNLYPLLVHVNLFGGVYVSKVVSILSKLV